MTENHKFVLLLVGILCFTILVLYGLKLEIGSGNECDCEDDSPTMDPDYEAPSTKLIPPPRTTPPDPPPVVPPMFHSELKYSPGVEQVASAVTPPRPKAPELPNE